MKRSTKPFLLSLGRIAAYAAVICAPLWGSYLPAIEGTLVADHGFAAWGAAAWVLACINAHTLSDMKRTRRKAGDS